MTYTTLVINDAIEMPIETKLLRTLPMFEAAEPGKLCVAVPMDLQFRHVSVMFKLIKGTIVLPKVDLNSHLDVLIVLRLAKHFGLSIERIVSSFGNWTQNNRWVELWTPEYMYLLYTEAEELVDFKKFFRLHKQVFESVANAAELAEYKARPELYVEMLLFFKNYDFNICFQENNDKVQARIETLNKERLSAWRTFLINPHQEWLSDYFKHVPTNYPVWSCTGISVCAAPEVGESTISSIAEVRQRLNEFTYGLLEKPLNPAVTKPFPFENVAIAGGAAAKILGASYNRRNARQSDADLFIFAKTYEERSKIFQQVIDWFKTFDPKLKTSRTYYALRGSVTTVYIKDVARKFQIISINSSNPYEIVSRFDLSHIQWCILNGQFFGTPEACKAMREKVTKCINTRHLKTNRMVKALHCGYSIFKDDNIVENHIDITSLITLTVEEGETEPKQNLQLQKLIRDLYGFYYPISDMDMEPVEEKQHILCMIERDSNATIVTDDPNFVVNNVTISGNFDNDYESILYSTFNPATIMNRVQNRRITRVLLRSKHGAIRLTSGLLKVSKIINNDIGLEIVVNSTEETFREFCRQLEGPVFRMFRNGAVSRHIIGENGEIKFNVPRYRLNQQTVRGMSCLRNQRGAALNIEEDLKPGDDLQILFVIEIVMENDERAVDLKAVKFVKYCKYDPEAVAQVTTEENHDIEVEKIALETEFDGEIHYEEEEN
ncbi:Hypothetical protein PACV_40 [Pacmanvirus A23]|uniref:Hypothetical protein n=1 Tax=Pacmanvirus A23 TaxID=1932881 RepID=UPI000A09387B|nr:Hypothetical protein B9W72_gp040 [Pacmanvirus A23]SIP85757.1 Hypothetical protein PACV_40 [Pacmanvirus A23]